MRQHVSSFVKPKTRELTEELHDFFMCKVRVPRFRYGNKQEIESLINEEAILLALYMRV